MENKISDSYTPNHPKTENSDILSKSQKISRKMTTGDELLSVSDRSKFTGIYPLNFSVTKIPRNFDVKRNELDPNGTKYWWIVESDEPTIDLNEFKTKVRDYLPHVFKEGVDLTDYDINQEIESQHIKDRLKRRSKTVQTVRQNLPKLTLRLDGELDISTVCEPTKIPDDILQEVSTEFERAPQPLIFNNKQLIQEKIQYSAAAFFSAVLDIQKNTPEIPLREIPTSIIPKVQEIRSNLIDVIYNCPSVLHHINPQTFPETKTYPIFYQNTKTVTQDGTLISSDQPSRTTQAKPFQPIDPLIFETLPLPVIPLNNLLHIQEPVLEKKNFDHFNKYTGLSKKEMKHNDDMIDPDDMLKHQHPIQYVREIHKRQLENKECLKSARLLYLQTLRQKRPLTSIEKHEWLELMKENSEKTSKKFLKKRKN